MSEPKASAETNEELDVVARANGFHLEESDFRKVFLGFLNEYGPEDVCHAKAIAGDCVALYGIVKMTKKQRAAKEMQDDVYKFLSKHGIVNNCPCTLFGDVMCVSATLQMAKRKSERLQVVRRRRSDRHGK